MIEIFCDFKKRKVSLEECLNCAKCLPKQIIKQLAKDFIFEKNRYGVTELVGCLRKSFFQRTNPSYPSLRDLYIFGRGLAFHYWFGKNFKIKEIKLVKRFKDFDIVGMPDAIDQKRGNTTLFEFKSVNYIPVSPYPQHILQIQGYYSIAKESMDIDKLVIIYFTMNSFKWFEVEKKDIMDFLRVNAESLHNALSRSVPPKEKDESMCRFCPFKVECFMEERGEKMGCKECEKEAEEMKRIYWYRWKTATIGIIACPKHAKEVIDFLNEKRCGEK